jgi:hypothetical protein
MAALPVGQTLGQLLAQTLGQRIGQTLGQTRPRSGQSASRPPARGPGGALARLAPPLRWRPVPAVWLAWSLSLLALAGLTFGLLLPAFAPLERWPDDLRRGAVTYDLLGVAFMAFAAVGAFLAGRRPRNPIGWILVATALASGVSTLANGCLVSAPEVPWLPDPATLRWVALWGRAVVLPGIATAVLLFPDGRLPSRRWWPAGAIVLVSLVADLTTSAVAPHRLLVTPFLAPAGPVAPVPTGGPGALLVAVAPLLEVGAAVAAALATVRRYRRARGEEHQQLKWFSTLTLMAAAGFAAHGYAVLFRTPESGPFAATPLLLTGVAIAGVPVALAVAVLRYHLYGIDVLLSRTLVYVPLTAILAGLYAASITLFQRLFLTLTGVQSDAALVLTTLVLSAAFTPIKNGLQTAVDARFGLTRDPVRRLDAFAQQVRSDFSVVDAGRLARRLLDEVVPAFQAQGGAVYLNRHGRLQRVAGGVEGPPGLSVPLRHGGAEVGVLRLGRREGGRAFAPREQAALRNLADLVASAIAP